jgi:hypothetical protein
MTLISREAYIVAHLRRRFVEKRFARPRTLISASAPPTIRLGGNLKMAFDYPLPQILFLPFLGVGSILNQGPISAP